MGRRYALRDAQWERIKNDLPRPETVRGTVQDNRLFVGVVLHRYRSESAGRNLPERFGDWRYEHFSRLAKQEVWEALFKGLVDDADDDMP